MPKGYKINNRPHYDVLGWIDRVSTWGTLELRWDEPIMERAPGTYVTKTHDVACEHYVPARRPRTNEDAMAAQREVREDPELAAEIMRRWREHSQRKKTTTYVS